MAETLVCSFCHDPIEGEPIRRGDKVYCCKACAFEASRSVDCGGRSDTNIAPPTVEPS